MGNDRNSINTSEKSPHNETICRVERKSINRGVTVTDVILAVKTGNAQLKSKISKISREFSYDETAYNLPISFALTGVAVHDKSTAATVFTKTGDNPLVASECLLAEATTAT